MCVLPGTLLQKVLLDDTKLTLKWCFWHANLKILPYI